MAEYTPEVGQMLFGNPTGAFDMPPYACSMLHGLLKHFDRIYWNKHQKEWQRDENTELGPVYFRPYFWGDDDDPRVAEANFGIAGDPVEIRWYKHPARGQSVNMEMTPGQWAAWHDRVYRALSLFEHEPRYMTHPDEVYHWHVEPVAP